MARKEQNIKVAGHQLKVTNLEKVLYPQTGTTKGEVIEYFQKVAPVLIPHAAWRPATRKRWVDGVGTADEPGKVFFRKDLEDSAPGWIPTATLEHKTHSNTYPLVNNEAVLAWTAQVAALEIHVPQWRFDSSLKPSNPDRMVLDLDPGPGASLAQCAEVALLCRQILDGMDLPSFPVTSGSKGIHLYAALDGSYTSDQINEVAKELATSLQRSHPDLVVANMKRSLRENKVLVDWSQNNAAKTTVCPYSLRGRAEPMVAAPRTWEEIESSDLKHLNFHEVLERVEQGMDPLAELALPAEQEPDRLSVYRSKRDASKTPEPVPEPREKKSDAPSSDGQLSFVIQEHHARRLHYDFRLEHDGVLVSWAVPKGPPLKTGVQRLAVMTEDHPLSYGSFEGKIPKGEYGAGDVSIWDSGTCTIEKWREGKEVIAVLRGRPDGGLGGRPRRFVLIHASGMGEKDNWLLQLTKDQPKKTEGKGQKPSANAERIDPNVFSHPPRPMLASAGTIRDIDGSQRWGFEMKWDGYRAIAAHRDAKLRLFSRNGHELTDDFPELGELETHLPDGCLLDGEIVALDSSGRPNFSLLQQKVSHQRKNRKSQAEKIRICYMVFDALALPDEQGFSRSLMDLPYDRRRNRLEQLEIEHALIKIPPVHTGTLQEAIDTSSELGLEGVVAKRIDSTYEAGRRSESWIKLKHQLHQEAVVIGWRQGQGSRSHSLASLLLAMPVDGELQYIGRVGTGFNDAQLTEIRQRLEKIPRKTPPADNVPAAHRRDAHWVSPKLVAEVRYSELTKDHLLRHPVWRGWRDDKSPQDVRWESGDVIAKESQ